MLGGGLGFLAAGLLIGWLMWGRGEPRVETVVETVTEVDHVQSVRSQEVKIHQTEDGQIECVVHPVHRR